MLELSRDQARELAVAAQGLAREPEVAPTKEAVLQVVRQLGCVQIDTISVVARSQNLVIWSRLGPYEPEWLDELLYPDRQVFEHWAHAASIIPIELFPYFRRRMQGYWENGWTGNLRWASENAHVLDEVRRVVREHGPVSSKHFDGPPRDTPVEAWSWWGGKPANRALDILWSAGELMIDRRVNFQRYYDLTERIVPHMVNEPLPDQETERRELALRAVRAMGVVVPRWLNDYFRTKWGNRNDPGPAPRDILDELASQGHLVRVTIGDLGPGYVAQEHMARLEEILAGRIAEATTLLSPFDNLIWDRRRTLELFDFDYRIECYTPAPKRKYGYFSLPILWRGRLVGRLDPKLDRQRRVLIVRTFHLEPGWSLDRPLLADLREALHRFAVFHRAEEIQVEAAPAELAGPIPAR